MSDDKDQRDDVTESSASEPSVAEDPTLPTDSEAADSDAVNPDKQTEPESTASATSVTPPSVSEASVDGNAGKDELAEVKDSLLRTRADFDNYKRRSEEERLRTNQVARTDVILDLLPVIDNFDRAFSDVPKEIDGTNWYEGVAAIKQQFEKILDGLNIERIKTVGEQFDPELHEAIAHEASDQAEDVIIKEFEAGFRLGDDVIRHARVAVSNGQGASS